VSKMPKTISKPSWMMNGISSEPVEHYMYSLLPQSDPVLAEMESAADKRDIPIVGPAVGRLLHQLALISGAKNIFEMGSAIGYSTIWWALAVGDSGRVIYTDGDRKNADEARGYFQRSGIADRIIIKVGDALEILSEQKHQFDIIFCDVDKEDYPRAFRLVLPRLRSGGLLIADNVLWSGKVSQKKAKEASTKAIQEFNRLLYSSPDLFTTILPIRDGIAIGFKK
jgi:predicted O-methyltransferase YrrM